MISCEYTGYKTYEEGSRLMALIALSTILSIILGSCVWLALGNRFPLNDENKWPIANNIAVYAVILVVPVFLTIFFSNVRPHV